MNNKNESVIFLFDYDNTLGKSEWLAFVACHSLVMEVLASKGVVSNMTAQQLMDRFVGKTFRQMLTELSTQHNFVVEPVDMEALVLEEQNRVIAKLAAELKPTYGINRLLTQLLPNHMMAVVSSSALPRVQACLKKANQAKFFHPEHVFSAASLNPPTSKPDPAVYLQALISLGVAANRCIAVEDSKSGVLSAVRAGIRVIGYVGALPRAERTERTRVLLDAGAFTVISNWKQFMTSLP